jgi:hypothetical protein
LQGQLWFPKFPLALVLWRPFGVLPDSIFRFTMHITKSKIEHNLPTIYIQYFIVYKILVDMDRWWRLLLHFGRSPSKTLSPQHVLNLVIQAIPCRPKLGLHLVEIFSMHDDLPSVKHVVNLQRALASKQEYSLE